MKEEDLTKLTESIKEKVRWREFSTHADDLGILYTNKEVVNKMSEQEKKLHV